MKAAELLAHLTAYVAQSPENGHAEVKLALQDGAAYDIAGANDARGLVNEHFLILMPDMGSGIGVKTLRKM